MKIIDFITQVLGGKTIYRILMNWEIERVCSNMSGPTLDLASGRRPSYIERMPSELDFNLADIKNSEGVSNIDFNEPLPYKDGSFNNVFVINAIYIVKDRMKLLSEIQRVLNPGGNLLIISPFVANEMPDPDDFARLTAQGLGLEIKNADFDILEIKRFGERFSSAAYLLDPFWYFRFVKLFVYAAAILLDKFVPSKIRQLHPTPIGYVCLAKKI